MGFDAMIEAALGAAGLKECGEETASHHVGTVADCS
jgi:hypothetical protein